MAYELTDFGVGFGFPEAYSDRPSVLKQLLGRVGLGTVTRGLANLQFCYKEIKLAETEATLNNLRQTRPEYYAAEFDCVSAGLLDDLEGEVAAHMKQAAKPVSLLKKVGSAVFGENTAALKEGAAHVGLAGIMPTAHYQPYHPEFFSDPEE